MIPSQCVRAREKEGNETRTCAAANMRACMLSRRIHGSELRFHDARRGTRCMLGSCAKIMAPSAVEKKRAC